MKLVCPWCCAAGRLTSQDAETSRERHARETRVRALFTAAAQYICLAAALQPSRDIYRCGVVVMFHSRLRFTSFLLVRVPFCA